MKSSDFRAHAAQELIEIRDEVLALATDRDVYWKVQREVIQRNHRLLVARNPFFDMMNDNYAHATASRVRRLVDHDRRTVSLRRLMERLADYPDLLAGKISAGDLKLDLDELEQTCGAVKDYVDQFVAHHDRNSSVPAPTHRQLNEAVDTLIEKFKKYYGLINDSDIGVVVSYQEDLFSIFRFPWIESETPTGNAHVWH